MKVDVQRVITNAKVQLIRAYPFIGHIIMQLPVVYVEGECDVNTMAVGKTSNKDIQTKLYINRDYVNNLFDKFNFDKSYTHIIEVLKHEVYHIVFRHLTIKLQDKHRQSIACECSVNSYISRNNLIDESGTGKAGVFPEDFGFENKLGVHEYYRLLQNNEKYKQMNKNSLKLVLSEGKSNGVSLDSHELWEIVKDDPIAEQMLKDIVRKAVQNAKKSGSWGSVPDELKSEIQNSLIPDSPAIPWQIILKQFVSSCSETVIDYTMKRRSKRYGTRPGTKNEQVLNLAIGIDTSGSVSDKMINLFFNELYWISKSNCKITIFEIDTQIHREYDFRDWDGYVQGRGGTNLQPLVREVNERKYDGLIFFTDMQTPTFEQEYTIPCLWVINNSYYKRISEMPYQQGIFLKLNDEGDGFELIPE